MQVYIGTYNKPKLKNLRFSRNLRKTKSANDAILRYRKNGGFWLKYGIKLLNVVFLSPLRHSMMYLRSYLVHINHLLSFLSSPETLK